MGLRQLIKRNMLIYFRDKSTVFFSFLSVIIILLLYILFLSRMQEESLTSIMGSTPGVKWLVSSWIMSGILTVSTVTIPLASLGTMIKDRETNIISDFYTSPLKRSTLALSYLLSTLIISLIMVTFNFIIGQIYIVISGGHFLPLVDLLKTVGVYTISTLTFTSLFYFISLFISSSNAFSLLSTLVGTFVGFLGGIYIPIGVLSTKIQFFMNLLPTAHSVTLLRNIYMNKAIDNIFKNAPDNALKQYADIYGLNITLFDSEVRSSIMLIYLIIMMVLFYILAIIKIKNSKL